MHAGASGRTPAGEAYRALDVELLDWVRATATYGFLAAYDRFVTRVPPENELRFYADNRIAPCSVGRVRSRRVCEP